MKNKKYIAVFFIASIMAIITLYISVVIVVPAQLTLFEGEEYVYDFIKPMVVSVKSDKEDVVRINGNGITDNTNLSGRICMKTQKMGWANVDLKAFGFIPIKKMHVDVVPNKRIAVCGNTIGVKLKTEGLLVIGVSDVDTIDKKKAIPIKNHGLKLGDVIVQANGVDVSSICDLVDQIDRCGNNTIQLKFRRANKMHTLNLTPTKSYNDGKYHIGVWVRESTAGIGTLTFYDPETTRFGALGHGITDIDTNNLIPVGYGEILESHILAIRKGKEGSPGELKGIFVENKNRLGVIQKNCIQGIYGTLNKDSIKNIPARIYSISLRNEVKTGPAKILTNIDGKKVSEYSVEIQKISRQNINGLRGMIIKITDPRLLHITGGIVQGMSGSPIIQNDKIVGAVTHVLVNDPTRGYGIFIEWMLKNISGELSKNVA